MFKNKVTFRVEDLRKSKVLSGAISKMPANGVDVILSHDGTVLTLDFKALPFEKAQSKIEQILSRQGIDFRLSA